MQVASGVLNQPPVDKPGAFQISVQTLGRLTSTEEFSNIVIKQTPNAVVRVKDIAAVELAAQIIRQTRISISTLRLRSGYSKGLARTRWRQPRRSRARWTIWPSDFRRA